MPQHHVFVLGHMQYCPLPGTGQKPSGVPDPVLTTLCRPITFPEFPCYSMSFGHCHAEKTMQNSHGKANIYESLVDIELLYLDSTVEDGKCPKPPYLDRMHCLMMFSTYIIPEYLIKKREYVVNLQAHNDCCAF